MEPRIDALPGSLQVLADADLVVRVEGTRATVLKTRDDEPRTLIFRDGRGEIMTESA